MINFIDYLYFIPVSGRMILRMGLKCKVISSVFPGANS